MRLTVGASAPLALGAMALGALLTSAGPRYPIALEPGGIAVPPVFGVWPLMAVLAVVPAVVSVMLALARQWASALALVASTGALAAGQLVRDVQLLIDPVAAARAELAAPDQGGPVAAGPGVGLLVAGQALTVLGGLLAVRAAGALRGERSGACQIAGSSPPPAAMLVSAGCAVVVAFGVLAPPYGSADPWLVPRSVLDAPLWTAVGGFMLAAGVVLASVLACSAPDSSVATGGLVGVGLGVLAVVAPELAAAGLARQLWVTPGPVLAALGALGLGVLGVWVVHRGSRAAGAGEVRAGVGPVWGRDRMDRGEPGRRESAAGEGAAWGSRLDRDAPVCEPPRHDSAWSHPVQRALAWGDAARVDPVWGGPAFVRSDPTWRARASSDRGWRRRASHTTASMQGAVPTAEGELRTLGVRASLANLDVPAKSAAVATPARFTHANVPAESAHLDMSVEPARMELPGDVTGEAVTWDEPAAGSVGVPARRWRLAGAWLGVSAAGCAVGTGFAEPLRLAADLPHLPLPARWLLVVTGAVLALLSLAVTSRSVGPALRPALAVALVGLPMVAGQPVGELLSVVELDGVAAGHGLWLLLAAVMLALPAAACLVLAGGFEREELELTFPPYEGPLAAAGTASAVLTVPAFWLPLVDGAGWGVTGVLQPPFGLASWGLLAAFAVTGGVLLIVPRSRPRQALALLAGVVLVLGSRLLQPVLPPRPLSAGSLGEGFWASVLCLLLVVVTATLVLRARPTLVLSSVQPAGAGCEHEEVRR